MDKYQKLREEIHQLYAREHAELGEEGTLRLLDEGRQWDLSSTLTAGGVIVFPHAGVQDCGQQIAAAVHACLDSGADRVVVISVLHAFTEEMENARIRVSRGGDPAQEREWGIQGPGLERSETWRGDHALISWRHFWAAETKRRGIKGPEVIERYPWLAGGHPERMPGIDELARLCEDAVIVSTEDPFHHGIGYGDSSAIARHPHEGGLDMARRSIEHGLHTLGQGDYWGWNQHCVVGKSDARDAGQVYRYIRGPMTGRIVDLTFSDATELYKQPAPTWVATALTAWTPVAH
jgi:hypothetical protein